jgi:predicted NBD/HSP70 family sugar kinase
VGVGIVEVASDPDQIHVSRFLKSRVMVGTHGLAGEIGHLPIAESIVANLNTRSANIPGLAPIDYAALCACGQPHHLQALVNGTAIAHRLSLSVTESDAPLSWLLREYLDPETNGADQAANRALEDAGRLIGRALTGSVLALDLKALTVIGALARPALVEGIGKARREWGDAFWKGPLVEMVEPQNDPNLVVARGAGLALLRKHRHRQLREIGRGLLNDQAALLPIDRGFVDRLRTS